MKIEISPEAFNALVKEYEKHIELYDQMCSDEYDITPGANADYDELKKQAFLSLFETVGMVIAEVVEEGLDEWCEQNRSIMEEALREHQGMTA